MTDLSELRPDMRDEMRRVCQIDIRFLHPNQQKQFDRKWRSKLTDWYQTVLRCFRHTNELPYFPKIFVIPFRVVTRVESKGTTYLGHHMGSLSISADDPDEWGIYLPYNIIRRAPEELNKANLAHELAHFHHRIVSGDQLSEISRAIDQGKSGLDIDLIKEQELKDSKELFEEPIRSLLQEEEKQKPMTQTLQEYFGDARAVNEDDFPKIVLGEERAKRWFADNARRIEALLESEKQKSAKTT